jgi:dTDP-4-dehydrorhamnose 3,5-epimerase-like enzyme
MLFVPVGFAHGFCVLSEAGLRDYKVSAESARKRPGHPLERPVPEHRLPRLPILSCLKGRGLASLKDADNVFTLDG